MLRERGRIVIYLIVINEVLRGQGMNWIKQDLMYPPWSKQVELT